MSLPLLGGGGGSQAGLGGSTDPSFSSVVFLWEMEGINGATSAFDLKNGRTITFAGTAKIDNAQALYGSTSLFAGSGGVSLADNADWDLSDANGDQFTIEISGKQTTLAASWDILGQFGSFGNWSFLCRWSVTGELTFFWSPDGTTLNSFATSGAGATSTSAWYDWCIEKNSSGKMRIYLDGVMKGSSTPGGATFFNSTDNLVMNTHGSSAGWLDHARITKGVARYDSDSGYTKTTAAFPTS